MEEPAPSQRHGNPVFALIFIFVGVFLLLHNLGLVSDAYLHDVWRLWPIILILMGLRALTGRSHLSTALFIVIAIALIGGAAILLTDIRPVSGSVHLVDIPRD